MKRLVPGRALPACLATAALTASALAAVAGPAAAAPAPLTKPGALSLAATESGKVAAAAGLGPAERLVVKDAIAGKDGARHLRYDRTYGGLPVLGGDLVVTEAADGAIRSLHKASDAAFTLSTTPVLTAADAGARVLSTRAAEPMATAYAQRGQSTLMVYAVRTAPVLAYDTVLTGIKADQTPSVLHVVTDAATGAVLYTHDEVETAAGTGESMYGGSVTLDTTETSGGYQLTDPGRGNQEVLDDKSNQVFTDADNAWGDGTAADPATAAVDAAYGAATTWDYYKNSFGRNGIADDGRGAQSFVHYGNAYQNAFWSDSCFCMTYGDGANDEHPLTALDVAGHEMSHGVTSETAGLVYSGESGGLNEATSDIFGTMVEFSAGNAADPGDYLIGERIDLFGTGEPLRYMDDPTKDGKSVGCWTSSTGGLDVHHSSGVANHFFYLLAEGSANSPTCGAPAVTGIGREKAAAIWYNALTTKFVSTTDYADARTQTLAAAEELYGAGSAEVSAVAAAWSAAAVD
ncbi:M4 family metallopeptidase [Actinokineospora bangkokensis]|uniref:Neutral metalloproteinase n=1 Tax=Actinokineospora bangkokensis TaxID=1193682 RepID=A0A1Q9LQM4_9PSEU|nr:M4 family metallopeptidase [Actinokineospora bangkokensis]OLR94320.1 hypothetical protein BJP25_11160 [Actinokineospora bangkokensis]